jgi:hypothetical protein
MTKPTIQPNQWHTQQEILEYVKADPRADNEKRFMIQVDGTPDENRNKKGVIKELRALCYRGIAISTLYKDRKIQFLHWCDENWEEQ